MNELDASTVLARARGGLSPSEEDVAHVRGALAATLATGVPVAVGAASRWTARLATRLLFASALTASAAGTGYFAGYRAGRRAATRAAAAVPAPAPLGIPAPPAAQAQRAPSAPSAQEPRRAAGLARPSHATSAASLTPTTSGPPVASLEIELRGLRGVERALRDHEPGLALALLRRLDAEVPNGKLVEEREATAAIARCALGDVPFDIDLARDFAERHPASVYADRVAAGCHPGSRAPETAPERIDRGVETKPIGGTQ